MPIFARSWLLAFGLLFAVTSAASADPQNLSSLLKTLDLRAYPSRTTAPLFSGAMLHGGQFSMAGHRGKVLVLNFWATWCLECQAEMPALQQLQRELASRGFAIVAINAREREDAAARYTRQLGLTFPVVLDPDGTINALYGVVGLPTTFVVGRDGRAVGVGVGAREWHGAAARTLLRALLDEPGPGSNDR